MLANILWFLGGIVVGVFILSFLLYQVFSGSKADVEYATKQWYDVCHKVKNRNCNK